MTKNVMEKSSFVKRDESIAQLRTDEFLRKKSFYKMQSTSVVNDKIILKEIPLPKHEKIVEGSF
jgi:hypothetical protein